MSHCYYGVNDDVVHVRAFQLWNISDFFPAAIDTGPTAEWGTWLEWRAQLKTQWEKDR